MLRYAWILRDNRCYLAYIIGVNLFSLSFLLISSVELICKYVKQVLCPLLLAYETNTLLDGCDHCIDASITHWSFLARKNCSLSLLLSSCIKEMRRY